MATNLGKMCHEEIYASTIALLATALAVGGVGLATDALARDGHPAAVAILTLMAAAVLTPSAVAPIPHTQEHHPVIDGLSGGADGGNAQWYEIVPR